MSLFEDNEIASSRRLSIPVFGTLCYFIGAALLFVVSFGRWRVRRWPTGSKIKPLLLEPTRVRVGRRCYFCADVAIFVGFMVLLTGGFVAGLMVTR